MTVVDSGSDIVVECDYNLDLFDVLDASTMALALRNPAPGNRRPTR